MSTIITRLFESQEQAMKAVTELRRRIREDAITVASGTKRQGVQGKADISIDDALEQLSAAGLTRAAAAKCGEELRRGKTAVVVRAPFGSALETEDILDEFGAIGVYIPDGIQAMADDPAPLSEALGLPTLADSAAPLSSLFGLPLLSKNQESRMRLINNPAPLSSALMMPVLSRGFEGRNSSFGMPLLSRGYEGRSSSMGMPLLSSNPAPLSTALGLHELSDNPTPLSSLFGWPVLLPD
jgi:hypothetical protein